MSNFQFIQINSFFDHSRFLNTVSSLYHNYPLFLRYPKIRSMATGLSQPEAINIAINVCISFRIGVNTTFNQPFLSLSLYSNGNAKDVSFCSPLPFSFSAFVLTVARLDYSFHGNWNQTETRTQQGIRCDRKSTDNATDLTVQWNLFRSSYQRSWLSSLSRTCSCGSLWPFVVEHPRSNKLLSF